MDRIETLENINDEERETLFIENARSYIEKLNIPAFNPSGLKLARSEKELLKCKEIIEKANHKAALKARDREMRENAKSSGKSFSKHKKAKNNQKKKSNFKSKSIVKKKK